MAWTDEEKANVVKMYQDREPTPETSTEIVKEIAEELEQSQNAIRMLLMQAKVYVKKDAAAAPASASGKKSSEGGSKRVSKEDSINALKDAIKAAGKTVDDDILDKLTGKAAIYFTGLFQ